MTNCIAVFCVVYSVLAVGFDLKSFRIPNKLIHFGYLAAFLLQIGLCEGTMLQRWIHFIAGALCPILLLWVGWIAKGIGAGDIKLLSVLGAVLGPEEIFVCSIAALIVGGVIGVAAKVRKRKKIHFSIAILAGLMICLVRKGK